MTQARIDRQSVKVARLARELRFEILLLRRMRSRASGGVPIPESLAVCLSMADVYAAALARRGGAEAD